MASGKTLDMINLTRMMGWRRQAPWVQQTRDRSLRGKARIKARKAANKQ